jgi:CheY-like chemotaxis protein
VGTVDASVVTADTEGCASLAVGAADAVPPRGTEASPLTVDVASAAAAGNPARAPLSSLHISPTFPPFAAAASVLAAVTTPFATATASFVGATNAPAAAPMFVAVAGSPAKRWATTRAGQLDSCTALHFLVVDDGELFAAQLVVRGALKPSLPTRRSIDLALDVVAAPNVCTRHRHCEITKLFCCHPLFLQFAVTSNRRLLSRALQRSFPSAYIAEAIDGAEAVAYVLRNQPCSGAALITEAATLLPGSCSSQPSGPLIADSTLATTHTPLLRTGSASPEAVTPPVQQQRPVDLIVMDHEMPVMNGSAATARLRQLGVACAIVGATGNAFGKDKDAFRASGVDELFTKPVNVSELVSWVRSRVCAPVAAAASAGDGTSLTAPTYDSSTRTMTVAASPHSTASCGGAHTALLVHPAPRSSCTSEALP